MSVSEVLNIVALIIVPLVAVLIGQHLQDRAEIRKDKMQVFRILMTARIYGWTRESVEALNIIDVVFADGEKVRGAWKNLYDRLCVSNPDEHHLQKIRKAQYRLLEEMASALGYKGKVTWETIQNPYVPVGLSQQMQNQFAYDKEVLTAVTQFNNMFGKAVDGSSAQSDEL